MMRVVVVIFLAAAGAHATSPAAPGPPLASPPPAASAIGSAPFALLAGQTAAPPAQQPPGTDIYELSFDGTLEGLSRAEVRPVASQPGYDNQPAYTPDGKFVLFTGNRDGRQTDIFEFDRSSRRVRPLTTTAEAEYSPTVTPDGAGISVIRVEADGTQRLWRFDRGGGNPRLVLTDIRPVGYHAWIDGDQLALFVLGKPSTLQHARVSTGTAAVVARAIGRSIQRIPGGAAVSFVHREDSGEHRVKRFDAATQAISVIAPVPPGNDERDSAWLPDGTLLMSSGTRILAWQPSATAGEWRNVFDATAHKLGAITRMAASPDGRALAIVVAEAH